MIPTMIEAALRSLLLALAVWAGLRVFRVRNVLAQKSAWGLVLASALLMPVLAPFAERWQFLPSGATLVLPPHPIELLKKWQSAPQAVASIAPEAVSPTAAIPRTAKTTTTPAVSFENPEPVPAASGAAPVSVVSDVYSGAPVSAVSVPPVHSRPRIPLASIAWLLYLGVAGGLLLRLFYGLALALDLWRNAKPISLDDVPPCAEGLPLRSSRDVSSPVTIGSGIVLPVDYADWDAEKLRIVLAHERSHIRQGDFYLQLLAALYAALVWFSPLGWWLKRTLSDLAETISDRAGLEQAASGTSYAQILLEFAAAPRPTPIGVAMARTGSLSRRIERLLNDSAFRQAFAGGRRRVLIAVLLVPVALYAATALVRVQAAQATQAVSPAIPAPAAQSAQNATPATDVSNPEPASVEAPEAGEPSVEIRSGGPVGAEIVGPVVAPVPPSAVPSLPSVRVLAPLRAVAPLPPMPYVSKIVTSNGMVIAMAQDDDSNARHHHGFNYRYSFGGDSYAIISGDHRESMNFSGDIHTGDIDKARKLAHGDFLWFTHDGKEYFLDDASTIAQIEAMYKPMEELGKQQEALGRQQEELGKQQEALGRLQEQASVPTPDMRKEMAEINEAMAKLQAKMGKSITQDELGDLQGKLGDLQGRLGDLQGKIGDKQGEFGAQQGKLGEQQGKLGAEQGRLGAEQGRIAREADHKVRSIIDESLQNGKAHPVE
jgi:hypothetical protein